MAYTPFNGALPNGATQNGTQFGKSSRDNLNALRDACIMGGGFFGFAMSKTGADPAQPTSLVYTKGTESITAALTWSAGKVTRAVYTYTVSGVSSAIGTKTINYDGASNVTSTSWS